MAHSSLETLLSVRRRRWLLLTTIAATAMFTLHSFNRLAELVEVQQLPSDAATHSILQRAEQNIMSHLPLTVVGGNSDFADASGGEQTSGGTAGGGKTAASSSEQATTTKQTIEKTSQQTKQQTTKSEGASSSSSSSSKKLGNGVGNTKKNTATATATSTSTNTNTAATCSEARVLPHTDYWGDALVWGSSNRVSSAAACCKQCLEYTPLKRNEDDDLDCNVWVWCGDADLCGGHYHECWLKHLAHPDGTAPAAEGDTVGWTSGIMLTSTKDDSEDGDDANGNDPDQAAALAEPPEARKYHVVITAQGPAVHWQSRVCYYWYLKIKKQCEEEEARGGAVCHMGGFTRVLHSGRADELMDEIPTFVADPLPPEKIPDGYVVLNRPYALLQWVEQAKIDEKYVLMSEPDHIWLKPMPNFMIGKRPAAFPFFYIEPSKEENLPIVRRFVGGKLTRRQAEDIAPIGNAPTMLAWEDLRKAAPVWYNMSLNVYVDPVANKQWGWVQEMYAFAMSLYKIGVRNVGLQPKMMAQPPWDDRLDSWYLLHYTYGMDYTKTGEFMPGEIGEWRFDKRTYSTNPPRRGLEEPPQGCENELVRHLIKAINEATDAIPGWNEYAMTGKAKKLWNGKV